MSRNSEKAQSMLFRFTEQQAAEQGVIDIGRTRRPKVISNVKDLQMCEKWRGQVVREVGRKVIKIQDAGLSDYEIRDLNDEINKLLREKHVWEIQIKNLGGPNYLRFTGGDSFMDKAGELPTQRGYKYFGRARDLPGVKELFDQQMAKVRARRQGKESGGVFLDEDELDQQGSSRANKYRRDLNAAYYGYLDEDDPSLLKYEANREKDIYESLINQPSGDPPAKWEPYKPLDKIPSQQEVEETLVNQRKRLIKQQYNLE